MINLNTILFFLFIFCTNIAYSIEFKGSFFQGHFIVGKTDPRAKIIIDKKNVKVSNKGYFVFGIDRDRKLDLKITKILDNKKKIIIKKIYKRKYNIQKIDGLPENKVTPPESVIKELKKKIIKLVMLDL